jgi:citrate lyase beta subunit
MIDLEPKFLIQMAHLTTPATVWRYVEGACTRSNANLVMLDLEDSIPRNDRARLDEGRENVVRAFTELDWGSRLRFFRPRGAALDPEHSDIEYVVRRAGRNLDGLVYPKIESVAEISDLEHTLTRIERDIRLPEGIKLEILIESVAAGDQVFEIARASQRLVGLIFAPRVTVLITRSWLMPAAGSWRLRPRSACRRSPR